MKFIELLGRLKIAHKLPLYIVGAGFAVGISIGVSTYLNAAKSLEEARRDQRVVASLGELPRRVRIRSKHRYRLR